MSTLRQPLLPYPARAPAATCLGDQPAEVAWEAHKRRRPLDLLVRRVASAHVEGVCQGLREGREQAYGDAVAALERLLAGACWPDARRALEQAIDVVQGRARLVAAVEERTG